jgi:hypothetical protein
MLDQQVIDHTAAQMKTRLDRASRRYTELQQSLKDKDLISVGDDLASMISEVKNIIYQFCRCWKHCGLPQKQAYPRIDRWRAERLSAQAAKAWMDAANLRDHDIHEAPVQPVTSGGALYRWRTVKGVYSIRTQGKVVVSSSATGDFELEPFCSLLIQSASTFVAEFRTLLQP